jgi:hypothetical protein
MNVLWATAPPDLFRAHVRICSIVGKSLKAPLKVSDYKSITQTHGRAIAWERWAEQFDRAGSAPDHIDASVDSQPPERCSFPSELM